VSSQTQNSVGSADNKVTKEVTPQFLFFFSVHIKIQYSVTLLRVQIFEDLFLSLSCQNNTFIRKNIIVIIIII